MCSIVITRSRGASHPDLPSHFFPGSGSDSAEFSVMGAGPFPEFDAMRDMLYDGMTEPVANVEYNPATGCGAFVVIDDDAPVVGTVINLAGA